jgi:prepilin-type N-terminal cleavage/methylation domain-containing protein
MKAKMSSRAGFTLVEIMIVVAIIALLSAIVIPNYIRTRGQSYMHACVDNLRQIDSAVHVWALEYRKASSSTVALTDIRDYLRGPLICPAGGTTFANSYQLGTVTNKPVCLRQPTGPYAHVLTAETLN